MIKKVFGKMLVAQIISAMSVTICMLVDGLMIGRYLGVDSMTAYGLVTPVLLFFAAAGSMISAGVQVLCSKAMGNGDRKTVNACFSVSVFLAALISIVGLALCIVFSDPLCELLGAGSPSPDNVVFGLTKDYLIGFIICAPAFVFSQIMVPYMQISGNRSRLVIAVILMTIADVVGDFLNIFVFEGGIFGMGIASSLSYYIAFAVGVTYFIKKDCVFKFKKKLIKKSVYKDLLKYGVPTLTNQVCLVLLVFVLNKLLMSVSGKGAVAAYSMISTLGNVCYSFGSGIAAVALMLASMFYNEEDKTALRSLIKTITYYALVINAVVMLVLFLLAPMLVDVFFNGDETTREITVFGLKLFSLSLVPCALNTTLKNYYQGINRTPVTLTISALQNFILTAAFAAILGLSFGTTGVWLGFVCGETTTLIVIVIISWINNKKISFSVTSLSMLPDDFGANDEDCFEASVTSMEEAVLVSQKASDFCQERGEEQRFGWMIALCIEEMTTNIVKHGFKADGKEHSIDIKLVLKQQERVIRIRDNCINFDPIDYVKLHGDDNSLSRVGIKMVMALVKDANYVNSFGLNNLTLLL